MSSFVTASQPGEVAGVNRRGIDVTEVSEPVQRATDRTGNYRPGPDRLLARLTPRERETLRAAVELGYYRNPREATYEDVAAAVDCAAGTVGHHLRNVETKVMGALLGGE